MNTETSPLPPARGAGATMALGLLLILGGALAITLSLWTTLAAVFVLGGLLVGAGLVELIAAFTQEHGRSRFAAIVSCVLAILVGLWFLIRPASGAVVLTMLLAVYFIASGAARLVASSVIPHFARGWVIASGVVSVIVGIVALLTLRASSLWMLGTLVGIDFIFMGVSMMSSGGAMQALAAYPERRERKVASRRLAEEEKRRDDRSQPPPP